MLKLTPTQKFEVAKTEIERQFACEFVLAPVGDLQVQTRMALLRVARIACNINVVPLRNILRDINPHTNINKSVINSEANRAYHLQFEDANFRKKMNTAHNEVARIIQEHDVNGIRSIASNAWNLEGKKSISDKGNSVIAQMVINDSGVELFGYGLNGEG